MQENFGCSVKQKTFKSKIKHKNGIKYIYFKAPNLGKSQELRGVREQQVVYDFQQNELLDGNLCRVL